MFWTRRYQHYIKILRVWARDRCFLNILLTDFFLRLEMLSLKSGQQDVNGAELIIQQPSLVMKYAWLQGATKIGWEFNVNMHNALVMLLYDTFVSSSDQILIFQLSDILSWSVFLCISLSQTLTFHTHTADIWQSPRGCATQRARVFSVCFAAWTREGRDLKCIRKGYTPRLRAQGEVFLLLVCCLFSNSSSSVFLRW